MLSSTRQRNSEELVESPKQLRNIFSPLTLCFFAVVMPGVWSFAAGSLTIGIFGAGPAVEVWGTLAVGLAISIFCLSLAEYGSAYPSAAGCTHVATELAGPKYGRLAGYLTGFAHTLGVVFTTPALVIVNLQLFVTCFQLYYQDWVPERWQLFLIFQGFNLAIFLALRFGSNLIPVAMYACFVLVIGGLFVTIGLLLGRSEVKSSNSFVWTELINGSGFKSDTMGILLGLSGPIFAFGPPHWLLNMSEDVVNPERNVPIALLCQQVGNISMLFAFYIAGYYSITDFTALFESTFESVVGALYLQGVRSQGIALFLLLLLGVPGLVGTITYTAATIRLVYGFARDGPFPYKNWFSKVDRVHNNPTNVLYFVIAINFLLGFVYLGSDVGFHIIIGSANAYYALGFLPMFIPVVLNGRKYFKRGSWFELPWAIGMACSIWTIIWTLFTLAVFCLPTSGPVTVENMNYTVVFVAFGIVAPLVGWPLYGRTHYLEDSTIDAIEPETTFVGFATEPKREETNKDLNIV